MATGRCTRARGGHEVDAHELIDEYGKVRKWCKYHRTLGKKIVTERRANRKATRCCMDCNEPLPPIAASKRQRCVPCLAMHKAHVRQYRARVARGFAVHLLLVLKRDPFAALADDDARRAEYKRLALLVHPDKCKEDPRAAEAFARLQELWKQYS